jgi:transposase-like protein
VVLSKEAQRDDGTGSSADGEVCSATCWWSMRERFCAEERQAMIDLYVSGATRSQVAERFGISVSSVKRALRDHGIRKRAAATQS